MSARVVVTGELVSVGNPPGWVPKAIRGWFTWTRRRPIRWTVDLPASDGQRAARYEVPPFEVYALRVGVMLEIEFRVAGVTIHEVRVPLLSATTKRWKFHTPSLRGTGTLVVEVGD